MRVLFTLYIMCIFFIVPAQATHITVEDHDVLFLEEPKDPTHLLVLLNGMESNAHAKYGESWTSKKGWTDWQKKNSQTLVVAINPPEGNWINMGQVSKAAITIATQMSSPTDALSIFQRKHGDSISTAAANLLDVIEQISAPHKIEFHNTIVVGQGMGGIIALNVAAKASASLGAVGDFLGIPTTMHPPLHNPIFTYILNDETNPHLPHALAQKALEETTNPLLEGSYMIVTRNERKHTFGLPEFQTFWKEYIAHADTVKKIADLRKDFASIPQERRGKTKGQRLKREEIARQIALLEKKLGRTTEFTQQHDEELAAHRRRLRIQRREQK